MAYKIIKTECTACSACEPECPTQSISFKKGSYVINPDTCTECEGVHDMPQCVSVCPIDECVVPA
ncbi:MAG: 4Fe-4S dicluster domain-containing protein [Azospirillum sp.]|nr:4Fe-4S dicluster domain-containing protein [Azospirillum sp.]